MDIITSITALPAFILIISGVLSLPVSAWLLWLYRKATLRGMARMANSSDQVPVIEKWTEISSDEATQLQSPLRFLNLTDSESMSNTSSVQSDLDMIKHSQLRAATIYVSAGVTYAILMTLISIVLAGDGASLGRALMLMCIYLWPTVIALCISLAVGTKECLTLIGGYALLFLLATVVVLQRNPDVSTASLLVLWVIINLPASVFFLLFLQDRIRSIGPLVFAFMLFAVTGAVVLGQLVLTNDSSLRVIISTGQIFGLGATGIFVLVHLAGFALLAVAARYLLHKLGDAYQRKAFSDRSITLDAMWLMFAIIQSINFAFEGVIWIMAAPVIFICYRLIVTIGFRMSGSVDALASNPSELLLLRVFSLGRRSNRFFEKFSRLWRQVGVINMIAGPDLVTASVEPHEFLEYAGGSMSQRFVISAQDLDERMHKLDRQQDPDARYRVHEFFCHDDTWRMTMRRLASDSSAILMDLRSFSESNRGCLYELKVLLDTVDLRRIIFLVDGTTNQVFLEHSFLELWSQLDQHSPNADARNPAIRFFGSGDHNRRSINVLISLLLQPTSENEVEELQWQEEALA